VTETQTAALIFSPVFVVFGVCFIVFRQHISDAARRHRREQGVYVGPHTQTPGLMMIGGAVIALAGLGFGIAALTGAVA